MLLNGSLVLVRAGEAEVIYLCTEPSCTQQHSQCLVLHEEHPRLPAQDPVVLGVLVTFSHGRVPGGTGQRPLTLLLSTHSSRLSWEDACWWSLGLGDPHSPEPWLCLQLPKGLVGWLQKCWHFLYGWCGHSCEWHGRRFLNESKR